MRLHSARCAALLLAATFATAGVAVGQQYPYVNASQVEEPGDVTEAPPPPTAEALPNAAAPGYRCLVPAMWQPGMMVQPGAVPPGMYQQGVPPGIYPPVGDGYVGNGYSGDGQCGPGRSLRLHQRLRLLRQARLPRMWMRRLLFGLLPAALCLFAGRHDLHDTDNAPQHAARRLKALQARSC